MEDAASNSGGSCELCGWLAAAGAALAFGTFGVPIKAPAAQRHDIDPLVFQSYKSFVCFITSWFILLTGEDLRFTPWGLVSALFWVPGGIATIYAVKAAGLAIGIGVGSSFIVLVSFVWGIFVFGEHVYSRAGACFAVFLMMTGLVGMSYFSSPQTRNDGEAALPHDDVGYRSLHAVSSQDEEDEVENLSSVDPLQSQIQLKDRSVPNEDVGLDGDEVVQAADDEWLVESLQEDDDQPRYLYRTSFCGLQWTKRQLGILAAAFCGIYGGSIMAPMKFAPADAKGTGYLISFGVGAMIVTCMLWILRYLYLVGQCRSARLAYEALPSFFLQDMWLPGGTAGLLWSIGNFFSLISVNMLGEGIGYPLVQTSILVAGLWGIFYFKEVSGMKRITQWLCSSLVTILGILLLSYEHHESTEHAR